MIEKMVAGNTTVDDDKKSLRSFGLRGRLITLALVIVVVGLVAIPIEVTLGWVGYPMAGLAMLVCGISSLVAHIAGEYPSGDDNFAVRLASSMAVRTGPPFLLVFAVKFSSGLPLGPGFVFLIVLFYIVGLAVDVSMQAARLNRTS